MQVGQILPANMMPSFQDIQEAVGFPEYFAQAERYTASEPYSTPGRGSASSGTSASSDSGLPASTQSARSDTPGTASQQQSSAAGARDQPSSMDPEPSQAARRQDVSDSSGLQAAAEEGQRAMEGSVQTAEVMAEGQLSSLDDELRDLDTNGGSSGRKNSAARESTAVVEPDAIVVSGIRKGGSRTGQAMVFGLCSFQECKSLGAAILQCGRKPV